MDRKPFFDSIRGSLFPGGLTQAQVDGINAILDEGVRRGVTDLRKHAYVLATSYHETARRMQPLREFGLGAGKAYGAAAGPYGQKYYGRGDVQLTWYDNYLRMGQRLGVDLARNPDLALDPKVSKQILWEGMLYGLFTGYDLSEANAPSTIGSYLDDRKIVNGTDKASTIAGYAEHFEKALRLAPSALDSPSPTEPEPEEPVVIAPVAPPDRTVWERVFMSMLRFFRNHA